MRKGRAHTLTTPDLVLLSLLAERPMHGYQANLELERRNVRDWADISRPQVYYSLEKLVRFRFLRAAHSRAPAAGPDRRVYAATARGRAVLADALEPSDWSTQRERPAFLTWMALSWQARPGVFLRQCQRRRQFLEQQLKREEATLRAILQEVGHRFHEAVWIVTLTITQFRGELRWLRKVEGGIRHRARARHPAYASGE